MTIARVIASLAGATLLGALINGFEHWFASHALCRSWGATVDDCAASTCSSSDEDESVQSPLRRLANNTLRTTRRVLPYFIAGTHSPPCSPP